VPVSDPAAVLMILTSKSPERHLRSQWPRRRVVCRQLRRAWLNFSGQVFERRLIETYIAENGKDPITGEETDIEDLVPLRTARIVKPRPPALTSIPSLLSVFQNEWDALALESFTVRQQLAQTRQELSTALYQNDAAVRVIARLTKERDEARDALSKVSINSGAVASNGDEMQVDSRGLPEAIIAKIDATQAQYVPFGTDSLTC